MMKRPDITGFGGGYEWTAQRMLTNGIEYLKTHPEFSFEHAYKGFKNVYGICTADTEAAKELDRAIMKGIEDATGAMHQCVVTHLMYIHKNGVDKWLSEFKPEDLYEFDGTPQSCPKTDLSEKMGKEIRNGSTQH